MNNREFLDFAKDYLTENRWERFKEVVDNRTRHLTVVLENVYQSQNTSAVLRSCDCFGVQDVHIIENNNEYTINPDVELGSSKWLDINRYNEKENNTADCLKELKNKGYRLVATSPHENDSTLPNLNIDSKTALLFGTELTGLSKEAMDMADDYVKIPMYGFTESFNISVSAALVLYDLRERLHSSELNWELSTEEKHSILTDWISKSVKNGEKVKKEFMERKKQS